MPRGRGLDPNKQVQIQLFAEAHRWAREEVPWDEAVNRLRHLVQQRPDLAGDAIGQHLGPWRNLLSSGYIYPGSQATSEGR